jgi:CelD/BcsL family acetyltransferase involved in cellulose biosynthesis
MTKAARAVAALPATARVRADWDDLASAGTNIFGTREWCEEWWSHFGAGCAAVLDRVTEHGSTALITPLYVTRDASPVVRFIGDGVGDTCSPVGDVDAAERRGWTLAAALAAGDAPSAYLERLVPAARWNLAQRPGWRVVEEEESPYVTLGATSWDAWLSGRSHNLRRTVRRAPKKLAGRQVRIRLTRSRSELRDDMATLFRLHEAVWGEESRGVIDPVSRSFHLAFAARALDRKWLRLWTLTVDGVAVASWYGFRFGGRDLFYQQGRDPRAEELSPGTSLILHTLRDAVDAGVGQYSFLRGGESYKWRFADSAEVLRTTAGPVHAARPAQRRTQ